MIWHNMEAKEILNKFNVSENQGLNSKQVKEFQLKYGLNKLKEKKPKSVFTKFLEQFSDFMVIILLIASGISFATSIIEHNNDYIDSIIILAIVIMNALIGVIQESKAEKAIDSLKKLSAPKARVIRNGVESLIDSEELVPGDILVLNTGDFVPADARIIKSTNLKAEESALTGESLPVDKDPDTLLHSGKTIADRHNMLYSSSSITAGHALCVVVETGMNTQVGKIADLINEGVSPQTPLQAKLAQTGKYLGIGALVICFIIFILGVVQNIPPIEMFMISISLAVAAIPEGLPAVVTIVLAIGVKRMAISRAIIRKLPAVETLGSASVICSDKTGTLTQNKMTVTEIHSINGQINMSSSEALDILSYLALCNNSNLTGKFGDYKASGEPTEKALVLAAANNGKVKLSLDRQFPRVHEIPFDSKRKLMTTIHKLSQGHYRVITKGAPDVLLNYCTKIRTDNGREMLNTNYRNKVIKENEEMASKALRVLAVAFKDIDYIPNNNAEIEGDLCFCGLVGMIDPPRIGAKQAVKDCIAAGIKPVMITGDHIITAKAIARELNILSNTDKAISGEQIDKMPQDEFERNIFSYSVFARVSPEHKVKIVKAFQKKGAVVAMTGDGVNDAPALKAADIGCAMGISGTDVAKGAADMILTDDNFSTIIEAVKQGRGIFENIKKTVHFLISSNIGEIITVLTAFLLNLPTPLLAIQLLWVNLVTDSFPALALGVEPVDQDIMNQKPVDPKKKLLGGRMAYYIAVEGTFIGAISLLAFVIGKVFFDGHSAPVYGRTMAFCVLSLSQIVHAFNVRSEHSLFEIGFFGNIKMVFSFIVCLILQISVVSIEPIAIVFKTIPLPTNAWVIVAALSLSPLVIVEIEKRILDAISKRRSNTKVCIE